MPSLSLLLNWFSPSAQNWQDISLKYRLSYFGNFFELCDVSMATRLALNRLQKLDFICLKQNLKISYMFILFQ